MLEKIFSAKSIDLNSYFFNTFDMIQPGQIYRHYKGKEYKIITIGKLEATLEDMVVYQALYHDPEFGENAVWIRPLTNFTEMVHMEEGVSLPRFTPSERSV